MASRIRSILANKLLQTLSRCQLPAAATTGGEATASPPTAHLLQALLQINTKKSVPRGSSSSPAGRDVATPGIPSCAAGCLVYDLSLAKLHSALLGGRVTKPELERLGSAVVQLIDTDSTLASAHLTADLWLSLTVPAAPVASELLQEVVAAPTSFWRCSQLLAAIPHQRVVVEFSSPNIAKPFHVGHLRSTILGHCLARLHTALGHHVTRINYLGDWGTQFGMLKYGFDAKGLSRSDMVSDAVRRLYEVYVWANQQAECDPSVTDQARAIFAKMEAGDQQELDTWRFFRDISIKDLQTTYARLGISFDEYHGESQYSAARCQVVLRDMEERGLLQQHPDGRKMYQYAPKRKVTVVKSDGSTIYLSRDIAAAVERYSRFSFDRHYYVVDLAQTDHFKALFSVLSDLGHAWGASMRHVRFGRIEGLSSRKGSALFLSDLLDDGLRQMMDRQALTDTTRVEGSEARAAADTLALSAVVVADLKQRRHRDYKFSWQAALQSNGDTGVRLQYTHSRLVTLQQSCGVRLNPTADASTLAHHPAAMQLIAHIARFDEVLNNFYDELEPCILVSYLFKLSSSISVALKQLSVRDAPHSEAEARLLLFVAAQHTLAAALHVLGLTPLNKM